MNIIRVLTTTARSTSLVYRIVFTSIMIFQLLRRRK